MAAASVAYRIGWLLVILAAMMLIPAFQGAIEYDGQAAFHFVASALLTLFVGGGLVLGLRGQADRSHNWLAISFFGLAWFVVPIFAALPLYAAGPFLTAFDAYFEALSAVTTTGATLVPDPATTSGAIIAWLAILQWLGGLAVLVVAGGVFSILLWSGVPLLTVPTPFTRGSLLERLPSIMVLILPIYTVLTAGVFLGLLLCGVPAFDAVCFALSSVSTGGLMPASSGIGGFGSAWAGVVVTIAMAAGGASIMVHWYWMRRRVAECLHDTELRFYGGALLLVSVFTISISLIKGLDTGLWREIGSAAFLAVSLVTTTGWTVDGMPSHHHLPFGLILGLPAIGGMALSTAGGIKLIRVILLFKEADRELYRLSHPNGVARVIFAGTKIDEAVLAKTGAVFLAFLVAVGALTLAVSAQGLSFETAIAASLSALSNTGPAFDLAVKGATRFADLPETARALLCVGMVLGRLEVLALLSLLNPAYWRQ